MTISPKTKKLSIILGSSFLLAGGIFILSASPARAAFFDIGSIASNALYGALGMIANLVFKAAGFFVEIAANLLEFTFSIEKFTNVAVVTAGWQVCRDIANIGFVLVLLVMAFDSVLQLNKYPIKTILPQLVIAALLINFSLVFCGMIIDFSQIMTHYFYDAAVGGNAEGLSGQLVGALNLQTVYQEPTGDWGDRIKKDGNPVSLVIGIIFGTAILLIAAFSLAAAAIFFIVRIVSLWLLMIFAPIAWVSMIVPSAPEIGGYWNKWWGEFLKWAFFAPIYMFFVYLAVMIASSAPITTDSAAAAAQNSLLKDNTISRFFGNGAYAILQYIAIIIVLLGGLKYAQKSGVAGAGAVMKAGGSMANWAKKKAKQYTVDKAVDAGKFGLNKMEVGAAKLAANIGGPETRFSGRMRAKAEQIRQKGFAEREKTEGNQAYGKLIDTMSEKDLMNEVSKGSNMKKLIAARKAKERGLLEKGPDLIKVDKKDKKYTVDEKEYDMDTEEGKKKYEQDKTAKEANYQRDLVDAEKKNEERKAADRQIVKEARDVFNSYGIKDDKDKTKEAKELEEARFDILDEKDQAAVIRRAKENGNLDKIKPIVAQNAQAMNSIVKELGHEFDETYKKWGKQAKDNAKEALKKSFTDNNWGDNDKGKEEKGRRRAYASVTGELSTAFSIKKDANGKVADGPGLDEMRKYVDGMNAAKVTEIRHEKREDDLKLIGQYAKTELVSTFMRERGANAEQKSFFSQGSKNNSDPAVKEFLDSNPGAVAIQEEGKKKRPIGFNQS